MWEQQTRELRKLLARRKWKKRHRSRQARLRVEFLEDRHLLAGLTVNSTADVLAADPELTLREAISLVNAVGDANTALGRALTAGEQAQVDITEAFGTNDTITFASGSGEAFETGGTIRLAQGEIPITAPVRIDGTSAPLVLITGDANDDDTTDVTGITDLSQTPDTELDDNTRIFNVTAASAATELIGLTLTGGRTTGDGASITDNTYNGGGVRSLAALAIIGSTISGNSTAGEYADGGGLYIDGDATITGSTISGNRTTANDARGGGLSAYGTATITGSTISGNSTTGESANGGGIFARDHITLASSTISGNTTANTSASGGGFYTLGTGTITDTTISNNATLGKWSEGGGGFTDDFTTITGSKITGNFTLGHSSKGGGILIDGVGIVSDTTIYGNSTSGDVAAGGGIFIDADATITNSTISGNSTAGNPHESLNLTSDGGGAYIDGNATITGSTISGNSTAGIDAEGGGIFVVLHATLRNTIVLGNVTNLAGVAYDEIRASGYTFNGHNIVGADMAAFDTTPHTNVQNAAADSVFASISETLADVNADNQPEAATGVFGGVLADNGGTAQSIGLRPDASNPALDAGQDDQFDENVVGIDLNGDGDATDVISTDARGMGFARLFDLASIANNGINLSDLGAVELQPSDPDRPVAQDDSASTQSNTAVIVSVLSNDSDLNGDPLAVDEIVSGPSHGQAIVNVDGTVTYTPNTHFFGTDVFTYTATDGSLTSNEATVTLTVNGILVEAVFQNGVDGYNATVDTTLLSDNPSTESGDNPALEIDGFPAQQHSLLRFDDLFGSGATQIPLTAIIESATLQFEVFDAGDPPSLHRMLTAWTETATWDSLGSGIQADGSEAAVQADATFSGDLGTTTLDVTSVLQAWLADPASNFGWAFLPSGSSGVDLRSSEYTTVSERPKLSVMFQTSGPARVTDALVNGGSANRSGVAELSLDFDLSVTVSSATALAVYNHTTSSPIDLSLATLLGNGTSTVTWDLASVSLPDGRYTAELPAAEATSAGSLPLAATHTFLFHVLAGDSSGNAEVDFSDFTDLTSNFNTIGGPSYGPGDLDGNGDVDFGDFTILTSNFNNILPLPVLDFGDSLEAGTSYPTTAANDGARHMLGSGLYLGAGVDGEADGQPHADALGDDNAGYDEDGVTFGALTAGANADVTVVVATASSAMLNAWVDFNADGDWSDLGEQVFTNKPLTDGSHLLSFIIPASAAVGNTFARFRVTTSEGYSFTGLAPDGEVEDYKITVGAAAAPSKSGEALYVVESASVEPRASEASQVDSVPSVRRSKGISSERVIPRKYMLFQARRFANVNVPSPSRPRPPASAFQAPELMDAVLEDDLYLDELAAGIDVLKTAGNWESDRIQS